MMDYRPFTIAAKGCHFLVKSRTEAADKRMTPALVRPDYVIAAAAVLVGKEPV